MSPPRAEALLKAIQQRIQRFKRLFRCSKPKTGSKVEPKTDELPQFLDDGQYRSGPYIFITGILEKSSSKELIWLERQLELEQGVRWLRRRGSEGEGYPIRSVIAHCVVDMSDQELKLVQSRLSLQWRIRADKAKKEMRKERPDDHEAVLEPLVPEELELRSIG